MIHDKYLIPGGTMIIDFPTGEIPALTTLYAIGSPSPPLYTLAVVNCSNGEIFVLLISNWPWPESLKTKSVYKYCLFLSFWVTHWSSLKRKCSGVWSKRRDKTGRSYLCFPVETPMPEMQHQREIYHLLGERIIKELFGFIRSGTDLKYRRYRTKWRQQWFLITVCPDSWTW